MKPLFSKTNIKRNIDVKRKLIKVAMFSVVLAFICASFCESTTSLTGKQTAVVSTASMAAFSLLSIRQLDLNPPGGGGDAEQKAAKEALLTEIKALNETAITELKGQLKVLTDKGTADDAELKSLKDKITALEGKKFEVKENEDFKTLLKEFSDMNIEFKAYKEKGTGAKGSKMSFEALCTKALVDNKDVIIKSLKEGKPFDMELKYPETVTEDNTILDGDTFQSLTQNTGIISNIRRRVANYLNNVSTGTIGTRFALWFEEVSSDGKPYFIHEKETKRKAGYKIIEKTEGVKKVAVRGKMSMEWMDDLPQFVAYLKNKLGKQMDIETEDKLFNGVGGTGSDEPLGIKINAVAFTGGSLAGKVDKATMADVIRAIALQVQEAFGQANAVFAHPGAVAEFDVMKNSEGLYIRPFWATNGNLIAGIKVIETLALQPDEFVGGDLTCMNVLIREGMTVRIGETGDDFQENKKSILMEQRLVQFISANDYAQIIKGHFTHAKHLLDPSFSS